MTIGMSNMITDAMAIEAKARRLARREGLLARKSRRTGGFMIIDPAFNFAVAGFESDLSAEEVIDYCADKVGA
jgi:hypothetical protein